MNTLTILERQAQAIAATDWIDEPEEDDEAPE